MAQVQQVKLLPYDSDYPTVWLTQVWMACAAEKLTSEGDKFWRAFLALDTKTAELVASIDPESKAPSSSSVTRSRQSAHPVMAPSSLHTSLQPHADSLCQKDPTKPS
uniref:Uncharacterized protein n=1 Tax=Lygus hesperus TaxID=30085 RepID=A0A0K8TIR1_LYGHE